jgi:insulysin
MLYLFARRRWLGAFALCVFVVLAGCAQPGVDSQAGVPVQSPNDSKSYRYIELDNGLRALLISDPTTEKAAAALDVYVGSASNPSDRGGLAHFLEHMLFLGTDKYPDSGEYARFVNEHGGSRNAYTAFEHTNYFFDIDKAHLGEALDRFGQFFISPRFDAEYVEREINAVNAEYQLGLTSDGRRNIDVARELVNPDHPFSILGVGTAETLADRPDDKVRDDLLAFYQRYYSANLMTLAVLGSEDLDALEVMVRQIFSAVPNHAVTIEDIDVPMYLPGTLPLQVNIRPEASLRELQLSFPMPNYSERYRSKPLYYLSNLIGHEGEGSLLSSLKSQGWAEALGAGTGMTYRGGSFFNISITLTEAGLANRDKLVGQVFEYIELLRREGPRQELYREQGQVAALQFRFREEVQALGYVTGLASSMQLYSPEDVLRGNYLMTQFEPALISKVLEEYFTPDNLVLTVIAPDVPVDRESEFYAAPYSAQTLDAADTSWRLPQAELSAALQLPAANAFIAQNVEMVAVPADNPAVPALVTEEPRLRIWFRQDEEFQVPKGAMYISFRNADVSDSPAHAAAAQLYASLLQDTVNEFTYPAMLAGLNFGIQIHSRGISFRVNGYNDKQLVLLSQIVAAVVNAEIGNGRFDNIRLDLIRSLENVRTTRAFSQVAGDARELLLTGRWDEKQLIDELRAMSPAQVASFATAFWAGSDVDVLLSGNYDTAEATRLRTALQPLLATQGAANPVELRVVKLASGDDFVYSADVEHEDSVLFWYLQAPADDLQSRAMAALTGQIVSADFFEDLRTEQQLGYVVSAFAWPLLDVPGVAFMVQSPSASATSLRQATKDFMLKVADPAFLSEEQYLRHRDAVLQEITRPDKNLWERSEYFWREIARRELGFDSRTRLAEVLAEISYPQWYSWYRRVIVEQPASLTLVAPGRWGEVPAGEVVTDPQQFKSGNSEYRRP